MILSDRSIRERLILPDDHPLMLRIKPFVPTCQKPPKTVSWGLSSFGYDFRLDNKFTLFPNLFFLKAESPGVIEDHPEDLIIDPVTLAAEIEERKERGQFVDFEGDELILPPGGFALGQTLEWFDVPRDCVGVVMGKSTYARCALNLNTTLIEPRWRGHITLELANLCGLPLRVRAFQGVGQIVFHTGYECDTDYSQKATSSYQDQTRPTPSKVL